MAEKKTKAELIHPFTLIDTVWRAYSKRVPFFTKLVLAPILFYLLLDTLSYLAEHGIPGQPLVILAQTIEHTVLLSIPLYTLAVIIQTFSTAAVLTVLTDPKITDVGTAYSKGAKKIVSLWWVSILSFLITSGGFLLFVIPGVMFSVWFVFSQYVLFNEGKRGVTALLQSREYVRGYFWQVTLRILFIALIAAALSSISGYVSMIFNNGLLAHMAQSVVSLITLPLVMIYQFKLYENVKSVQGEVASKMKPWWLYLIASLVPFILLISAITILVFLKPFQVPDNTMMPTYKKGARMFMGEFPGVNGATQYVIYRKDGSLVLRRVIASPDETLRRKGNKVAVIAKNGETEFFSHNGTYDMSFFIPPLTLADGKEIIVGRNDIYVAAENIPSVKQTWEKITIDKVAGVPLFCYWDCTGKE